MEMVATLCVLGLLIAFAIPTYTQYQTRAKITEVLKVMQTFLDEAKKGYVSAGTVPTSVLGVTSGTNTAYTESPYVSYIYYNDGSGWANSGKAALVKAIVSNAIGSGITGFVAGTSGTANTISMGFVQNGEILEEYCGSWADDGTQVPLEYLPAGCQNDAFASLVTG